MLDLALYLDETANYRQNHELKSLPTLDFRGEHVVETVSHNADLCENPNGKEYHPISNDLSLLVNNWKMVVLCQIIISKKNRHCIWYCAFGVELSNPLFVFLHKNTIVTR
ncbi:hypothetical protein KPH14_008077 [Odynerus spinipes]|uniref:Uncharacterized protein n=1 Tax=Odynerus spinipes TaxID=1348599 RepID=A0AAD9RKF5_9HYME|nr:hypothetical protein KPH14_008077 [Odynerus spinipes]